MTDTQLFQHSGFFALCTPLLPFEALRDWTTGLELSAALDDERNPEAALEVTIVLLRDRLATAYASPELKEALFVGSPSLFTSYPYWLDDPSSERGQRIERALVRYYSHMAARSTPFGLCAGLSVGEIGSRSKLTIAPRTRYRRCVRLNTSHIAAMATALEISEQVSRRLIFAPNCSLYRVGPQLRYTESRHDAKGSSYNTVAIEPSDILHAVLKRSATGATLADLVRTVLEQDTNISTDDAEEFIRELVSSQVLVSTLQPALTGEEPFKALVRHMSHMDDVAAPTSLALQRIAGDLNAINAGPLGLSIEPYQSVSHLVDTVTGETGSSELFRVDLVKPSTATLNSRVVDELLRGVRILRRFYSDSPARAAIMRFRYDFVRRYDDREVPLVEVLDEDYGLGFGGSVTEPSNVLEGIAWPERRGHQRLEWTPRDSYLLARLQTLEAGVDEMEIGDSDVVPSDGDDLPELPHAVQVVFRVETDSATALEEGRFRLCIDSVGGTSGANILGPFCHAADVLNGHLAAHVRQEEASDPDTIFAEVVHCAGADFGKEMSRPAFRRHEIVCVGRPGTLSANQIPITDLLVSVQRNRIMLRSFRLGRRISPVLTAVHDYRHCWPAIYRFLCSLHYQDVSSCSFDWGRLNGLKCLPRVVSGKCVLAPAQWTARRTEFERLTAGSRFDAANAFRKFSRRLRLPRYFCLNEGDHQLLVDSENALSVAAFSQRVKRRELIKLSEMLPAPNRLAVSSIEGSFSNEIVLPLVKGGKSVSESAKRWRSATREAGRVYIPGSEWMFAKLYCGNGNADRVLCELVAPLVREAVEKGVADQWFFIRYGDPDWHIRLRIHGQPDQLSRYVIPMLSRYSRPLLEDGTVWKIQLDTYCREIERYGGPDAIILAEALFCADSDAALEIITQVPSDVRLDTRWRLTLIGMDRLLDDFGLSLDDKAEILRSLRAAFRLKHGVDKGVIRSLGSKYRCEKAQLGWILEQAGHQDGRIGQGVAAFERRSRRMRDIAVQLTRLADEDRLGGSISKLCRSYLHMHANRMIRADVRRHELVLYEFLARLYDTRVALRRV
jgi:thiopeptide-type bacteriocin biosynthesis protein